MSTLTVLAFDPGGTTGWAAYKATKIVNPDGVAEYYDEVFNGGVLGPDEHHTEIEDLIDMMRTENFHLVTESFEFRQGKQRAKVELISRDYIGVMTLWSKRNGIPLHQQTAALGKGFVNDQKLKVMDLYANRSKHTRDAYRHLIFYLVNRLEIRHLIESWRNLA